MELYNAIMQATRAALNAYAPAKHWAYEDDACWAVSDSSELVMQRDAAYELGGSGKPSANFTCVTSTQELVDGDGVFLYGRDLREISADVPFARIVFLSVNELSDDDEENFRAIRDLEFIKYRVHPQGYMVRISAESNQEQVRISKDALRGGVDFRRIGNAYIRRYKQDPRVRSVQVLFVTDYPQMRDLAQTAKKVDAITMTLTHILEGLPTDCGSCQLKAVCDEVEGMREMHMKSMKKVNE